MRDWLYVREQSGSMVLQQNLFNIRKVADSHSDHAFFNPASTRFGVNGASRRRTPTASKIALAMAAAGGMVAPSPAPSGSISGRLMSTISRSGRSGNLRIG